jgi:hypothetical protein
MLCRNAGVSVAVLSLLASAGFAFADQGTVAAPKMSIAPTALNLDAAAPSAPLMAGLEAVGVGKPLEDAGINIYGYIEAGYTYNQRENQFKGEINRITPGAFNYQHTNSVMLNQVSLFIEKKVDSTKAAFDVGGKVWVMYGTDSDVTRSNGMQIYAGMDAFSPTYQFDFPEAYIDVAVPVNGLSFRVGKFATLIGNEYLNPTLNPFYSRSWLYASEPITQTGVLADWIINPQWEVKAGVTRGWDQALKDSNGAPDFLGEVVWTASDTLTATFNTSVGPEDAGDTGHYRVLLNPIVSYTGFGALSLAAEGLYVEDGAINATGGYGDYYGAALYAGYKINSMFTLNARGEGTHFFTTPVNVNIFELTLGVTITPLPDNQWFSGLEVRPEVRYDWADKTAFATGTGQAWHDQLSYAIDVIYKF